MKTIQITLLLILSGFCFYISDPLIVNTPAQIMALFAVFCIGLVSSQKPSKSYQTELKEKQEVINKIIRQIEVNEELFKINEIQKAEINQLKDNLTGSNLTIIRLKKWYNGLKSDYDQLSKQYNKLKCE